MKEKSMTYIVEMTESHITYNYHFIFTFSFNLIVEFLLMCKNNHLLFSPKHSLGYPTCSFYEMFKTTSIAKWIHLFKADLHEIFLCETFFVKP